MVAEIKQLTIELLPLIEQYKNGQIPGEELESKTSQIIIHDDYEQANPQFQHAIEVLDNWDVEQLKPSELDELIAQLRRHIEKE